MRLFRTFLVLLLASAGAKAEVVIEQWGPDEHCAHKKALKIAPAGEDEQAGPWTITVDLRALPAGAKVYRASLLAEREPLDGRDDAALVDVQIYAGGRPAGAAKPLAPEPPWFAGFDATDVVRRWAAAPGAEHRLFVKAFPGWKPQATRLEIAYEAMRVPGAGRVAGEPPQVGGLTAIHRAGQTFLTWQEIEDPLEGAPPTWGRVRAALEGADAKPRVRYLVFRHTEAITAGNISAAALVARVGPLSGYNVHGRSVEELVATVRRRAIDDTALARKIARSGLHYTPDSPEMDEVVLKALAIEDGKPLAGGTGLYVHSPAKAGKAHYAVVSARNGTANLRKPVSAAVEETVGPGEPVRQPAPNVTVFYDYPGQRRQYVQWTAPPLSHLPNQYYNWSVYVPPDPPKPTPVRMAFTTEEKFIKPGLRHRADTVLLSGQDRPIWSQWYGYHEALGTLKSFKQGKVQPFTQRRLFAFLEWVVKTHGGDARRLSCIGGTDALYYGVKHGEKFAYVLADSPDPDPQATAAVVRAQNYTRRTPRPLREAAWGKAEWKIPGEGGRSAWEEFDLVEHVKDPKRRLAFLSMGPAMLSSPWPNQVKLMKQLWASRQGFTARFYWGGGAHLPIPEGAVGSKDAFDFALDIPFLALRNNSNDTYLDSKQFTQGVHGYGSGGRVADGRRWLADFVDSPDRFEITIHGRGQVAYAGGGTSDVTPRRTREFKPKPGERFRWENVPLAKGARYKPQSGEVVADEDGLVTVPGVSFHDPSRLKIYKAP